MLRQNVDPFNAIIATRALTRFGAFELQLGNSGASANAEPILGVNTEAGNRYPRVSVMRSYARDWKSKRPVHPHGVTRAAADYELPRAPV